jgi:hypothetical protein
MENDLYFKINPKERKILDSPKPLELNWNNIGGLPFLSEEQLLDLSWAGYDGVGFIKYDIDNKNSLRCYSCDEKILLSIKWELIKKLSEDRYNYECGGVIINNQYKISTDDRSKLLLQIKYSECLDDDNLIFNWKTSSGFVEFTSDKFINLYKKIRLFYQKCFDIEFQYNNQINSCNEFVNLLYLNLNNIPWNFNNIIL